MARRPQFNIVGNNRFNDNATSCAILYYNRLNVHCVESLQGDGISRIHTSQDMGAKLLNRLRIRLCILY